MKNVRLASSQLTRWRLNRFALLDNETGEFVRYANEQESIQATEANRRGRIVKVRENGRLLNFRLDRERLKEELVKEHGQNVRALARNNTQLFVARTFVPTIDPTEKPTAPHPNRCKCSEWEGRPDGKHHPHCSMNKLAPDAHRSDLGDIELGGGSDNPEGKMVAGGSDVQLSQPLPPEPETEPEPETKPEPEPENVESAKTEIEVQDAPIAPSDCECLRWRRPEGFEADQHHPTCPHYEPWRSYAQGQLPYFVFTSNGTLMRRASPEEITEMKKRLETVGSPTIRIGAEEFLVLNESP